MNELLVLLLPLAAFSGWWLSRTDKKIFAVKKEGEYLKGLSYLLEDQTDKAIDVFFRMAHLDDSTIESQMTLGDLFRHRGEIDRALHIHSSLINKKNTITSETRQKLNISLAEDYLSAGIMNRAEEYYQLVRRSNQPNMREIARRKLVKIYADQSEWTRAIELIEEIDQFKKDPIQKEAAHFYCELAEKDLENDDKDLAKYKLKNALGCDENCIRASIKLGILAKNEKNYVLAIGYFNKVEKQNPNFLSEVLDDLEYCYSKLNQQHEWKMELSRLVSSYNNPVLMIRHNQLIRESEGIEYAKSFLIDSLENKPNILALQSYLKMSNIDNNDLDLINKSFDNILAYALRYHCSACGFRGNTLNWYCPGCKKWGTSVPISDISVQEYI